MVCIYLGMFVSLTLCMIGVVLSIIDVNKYNFGLYLALLSIVTFTISLACMVVKPTVCRGPRCLTKLLQPSFRRRNRRNDFRSNSRTNRAVKEVLYCRKETEGIIENVPRSPTPVIVQPPDDGPFLQLKNNREKCKKSACSDVTPILKSLRFVEEVAVIDDKPPTWRGRAFTAPSSFWRKEPPPVNEHKSAKDWHRLIITHDPALLLHSAFPLCEKTSLLAQHSSASSKSYSSETVVDLTDYCRRKSLSQQSSNKSNKLTIPNVDVNHSEIAAQRLSSPSSNTNSPWKRSHTIIVKYVPVRSEWLPKPVTPSTSSEFEERERSHSSVGLPTERSWTFSSQQNPFKRKFFPNFLNSSTKLETTLL